MSGVTARVTWSAVPTGKQRKGGWGSAWLAYPPLPILFSPGPQLSGIELATLGVGLPCSVNPPASTGIHTVRLGNALHVPSSSQADG